MYNTSINNLEKEIIEAINKSRLHIGTISLVLNKVSNNPAVLYLTAEKVCVCVLCVIKLSE